MHVYKCIRRVYITRTCRTSDVMLNYLRLENTAFLMPKLCHREYVLGSRCPQTVGRYEAESALPLLRSYARSVHVFGRDEDDVFVRSAG
jgi:hypothetical protein